MSLVDHGAWVLMVVLLVMMSVLSLRHLVVDIPIGTVGGVVTTQKGPVIAILHQYTLLEKGTSIHSPVSLRHQE
jgi:hypothetical protein